MVSDWSGAATEYAFATHKPVIYIDTPQKLSNPDALHVGIEAFEQRVRKEIGVIVAHGAIATLPQIVQASARERQVSASRIAAVRQSAVFNVGMSASIAAESLSGS